VLLSDVAFGIDLALSAGAGRNLALAGKESAEGAVLAAAIPERIENTMQIALQEPKQKPSASRRRPISARLAVAWTAMMLLCSLYSAAPAYAAKDRELPSPGLTTEFSASLDDVLQALQEVLHDQIIHGTTMFDKDKTLTGATTVDSTPLFEPWREDGKVFYKIRTQAIAPRHFQNSADQGTIAVRYVLTAPTPERTRLRIDAIFVENARHGTHASDGTVESSESKIIQERVQAIQDARQEASENQRRRESVDLANQTIIRQREDESAHLAAAESSARDLEQRVDALRHQIEMRVKAPGAILKSAPFESAADVANLTAYTDILIVIVTPRWFGVEAPDGRRGWLPLNQLEPLP
jgi:hypothetical protein